MKAHQLLKKEDSWTWGTLARSKSGKPCRPRHPGAESWCAIGAISRCYRSINARFVAEAILSEKVGSISEWNDNPKRTHDDVIRTLKKLDI